jgi:hypothetical protein
MSTFGETATLTEDYSLGGSASSSLATRVTLAEAGLVSNVTIRITNNASVVLSRAYIWSDNASKPGATILGTSNELSWASGGAAASREYTFPSAVSLASGSYWIGIMWNADGSPNAYFTNASGGLGVCYNTFGWTYPNPPNDGTSWTVEDADMRMTCWGTYTASGFTGLTVTKLLQG